ncbi:PTS sugar transporter subunit IIC, partial [Enterobacter hormaechei]|nr:PTS sugar transporter subunit IIC [Enterobacter hormaechei]
NINEPVIFGLPIVFNLPLMIPFVLLPAIGIYFAWLCTTLGLMSRCVVMIPWTTPPILSAWLATAGDWR